jgi:ribonuclease D
MNELKSWRKRTADELLKPVFNVVRNAVIEELVRSKPRTLDELKQLPGVGPSWIDTGMVMGIEVMALLGRRKRQPRWTCLSGEKMMLLCSQEEEGRSPCISILML